MKPTKEQVIAWAREVWGDDSRKPWSNSALLHITELATLAYEAGRKEAPPQRPWQGLTDEEKVEIQTLKWWDWEDTFDLDGYTRAIEAKLKEKNNG